MLEANNAMKSNLLTVREVATVFFEGKISTPSIYRLVEVGEIPSIRVGGKLLVRRSALEAKYGGSP